VSAARLAERAEAEVSVRCGAQGGEQATTFLRIGGGTLSGQAGERFAGL
jgi:hypothetical protein